MQSWTLTLKVMMGLSWTMYSFLNKDFGCIVLLRDIGDDFDESWGHV